MAPHPSPYKSTGGLKRVANAVRYSMQGLVAALRYESAFRQELLLAAVLTPAARYSMQGLVVYDQTGTAISGLPSGFDHFRI